MTPDLDQKDKAQANDADLSEWICVESEVIKILLLLEDKKELNKDRNDDIRKISSDTNKENMFTGANNLALEVIDSEDPLYDYEHSTERDNQNKDEELKSKYPKLYARIYRIMERSHKSSGVTFEELCFVLRFVANEEMVREILFAVSWVVKLNEKYYFRVDLSKEVSEENKNDYVIDTDHFKMETDNQNRDSAFAVKQKPVLNRDRVKLLNEQRLFSELLNVKEDYKDETIAALNLSDKAAFILRRKGWMTINDLLSESPNSLLQCRNLGIKTFNEIINKLAKYCDESKEKKLDEGVRKKKLEYSDFIPYQEDIILHRWGDIQIQEDNKVLLEVIENMALIDDSLLNACVIKREMVVSLLSSLNKFYSQYLPDDLHIETFEIIGTRIPADRLHHPIKGYIIAFTNDENDRKAIRKRFVSEDTTVQQYLYLIKREKQDDNSFKLIKKFLYWLTFDLASDIASVKENLYRNERDEKVISLRSKNVTLEQVGKALNVSRERVRQIENKVRLRFSRNVSVKKLMKKIYAIRGGNAVLSPVMLQEYFGDDAGVFLYLLRVISSPDYVYDSEYDVFIVEQTMIKESYDG